MPEARADVAPGAVAVLRTIGQRLDYPLEELADGLFVPSRAEDEGLSWEAFCDASDRLAQRAGSLDALAEHGACAITVPELGRSIRILRTVIGCQGLYWANFRWGGPSLFRTVKTSFTVRRDGGFVGTIALPDEARHSEPFFYICKGVFSALPKVLGLQEARVDLIVTPRFGSFAIQPPSTRSWFAMARWFVRALISTSELVDQLADQNARLTEERRAADHARALAVQAQRRAEESLAVAEARRTEAELARAHADEALRIRGEFVSTVSHELRTPLNGILGMTQVLLDQPLPRDVRDQVATIGSSGRNLLGLINELLDFSKVDAGRLTLEPQLADLRTVVEEVAGSSAGRAADRPVEVVGHVAPDVPARVTVDPARLRQVLANLMDNAVKFTATGSVVLRVSRVDARLHFVVTDTGLGIAPRDLERIFEPFVQADGSTTRRFGGTGLGLSIARALVRLMGGEIAVRSTPGTGSEFSFAIPLGPHEDGPVEAGPPVAVFAAEPVRASLVAMLATLGHPTDATAPLRVVDLDSHASDLLRGAVGLARGTGPAVAVRKPARRADLRAALEAARGLGTPGRRPVRVAVIDDDPLHHAVLTRLVARAGALAAGPEAADIVLLALDAPDEAALGNARTRHAQARVEAVVRPVSPARVVALLAP